MNDRFEQERRDNVSGYIIRMWHLEDLLRAARFDVTTIKENLVDPMDADEELRERALKWYVTLADRMVCEGVAEGGHLRDVDEALNELEQLHQALLADAVDPTYAALYREVEPAIQTLSRQGDGTEHGVIETCFTGIYGVMVLQAQGRELSEATVEADRLLRKLMEQLSVHYRNMRKMPGISLN